MANPSKRLSSLTTVAAADLEQVFADLASPIGGTWYSSGAPIGPTAGSLAARHFKTRAGFRNAQKASPYAQSIFQFHFDAVVVATQNLVFQLHSLERPRAAFTVIGWNAVFNALNGTGGLGSGGAPSTFKLYSYGTGTWTQIGATQSVSNGQPQASLFDASFANSTLLNAGEFLKVEIVGTNFNGGTATTASDMVVTVTGKSLHAS